MFQRPFKIILILHAVLLAFLFFPEIRSNQVLVVSFLGTVILCALWSLLLFSSVSAKKRQLSLNFLLARNQWIQLLVQVAIVIAVCMHWSGFTDQLLLIFAQVIFAYIIELLCQFTIRDRVKLGFGPFPIVISINFFIWFKDEYFYLQFLMVALGILFKYLFTWNKWGSKSHIFNPSSLSLCVFSLFLMVTQNTVHLTHAFDVSTKLYSHNAYLLLFLTGIVVQYFFSVTLMTLFGVATLVLLGMGYHYLTGIYWFIDTNIPPAVFLGLHLLITDPKTAPRSQLGRSAFGILYGISIFALYGLLDYFGTPTFYDKILFVPILNLMAPWIDEKSRYIGQRVFSVININKILPILSHNILHITVWVGLFTALIQGGFFSPEHPGRSILLWDNACAEKNKKACQISIRLQMRECREGRGEICNLLGVKLLEKKADGLPVKGLKIPEYYFNEACLLDHAPGCLNFLNRYVFIQRIPSMDLFVLPVLKKVADNCKNGDPNSCYVAGFAFYSGSGVNVSKAKAAFLFDNGCNQNQFVACGKLGHMYLTGDGVVVNSAKAEEYFKKACEGGDKMSCQFLDENEALWGNP